MGCSAGAQLFFGEVIAQESRGETPEDFDLDELDERLRDAEHLGYTIFGHYEWDDVALVVQGSTTGTYDYGIKEVELLSVAGLPIEEAKREAAALGFPDFNPRWLLAADYG